MIKKAIEYLIEKGSNENPIVNTEYGIFSKCQLERVKEKTASSLAVHTLTGLVDYIKNNIDEIQGDVLIHIQSPEKVKLYGPLNKDKERDCYITAEAELPRITYERFVDPETFNIMLQSNFEDKADRALLLKYSGCVQNEAVTSYKDDGVGQAVTVKTGIANLEKAELPNPVELAPFRTFVEVEQPTSKFIFRANNNNGIGFALFEADGGAWRNEAIKIIKAYLEEELAFNSNVKIIA